MTNIYTTIHTHNTIPSQPNKNKISIIGLLGLSFIVCFTGYTRYTGLLHGRITERTVIQIFNLKGFEMYIFCTVLDLSVRYEFDRLKSIVFLF